MGRRVIMPLLPAAAALMAGETVVRPWASDAERIGRPCHEADCVAGPELAATGATPDEDVALVAALAGPTEQIEVEQIDDRQARRRVVRRGAPVEYGPTETWIIEGVAVTDRLSRLRRGRPCHEDLDRRARAGIVGGQRLPGESLLSVAGDQERAAAHKLDIRAPRRQPVLRIPAGG